MAGQNIGAGKPERVKSVVNITLLVDMAVAVVSTAAVLLFPVQLISIFDTDPEVIELCTMYLHLHIINCVFQGVFSAYNASVLGCGNAILSTLGFLTDGVVLRLSLCIIFTKVFTMGLFGVFLANAVAPIGAAVILGAYHYSGKWKTYKKAEREIQLS